jgi:glycosyltransferase involved in cell wall biosynthesis
MKIFLNDNIQSYSYQRGVTRAFWHIADGLIEHYGKDVTIFSAARRDFGPARHIRSLQPTNFKGMHRLRLHRLIDLWAAWASNLGGASVFFSPYYGTSHPKAAQFFVVHDMIHALPEYRNDRHPVAVQFRLDVKSCLERARCLIAVSQNTADDIVKCYPHIAAGKIVVVHHGVDASFFEPPREPLSSTGKPFFMFVGNRAGYKNFLRLLQAFGESGLAKDFDLRVISPVQRVFNRHESALIRELALERSVFFVEAGDEDLRAAYASAVAFVYPSEYEGFGMPVLEAMAAGALVATSNRSSIPEAGGDAALYFDPLSVESIADCLRRVARLTAEERESLKQKGLAHAREFTWERAVQKTVQAIERFA